MSVTQASVCIVTYGCAMPKHPTREPGWIDDAPIRVERTVDIDAPPAEVWSHIADHASWPEWFPALDRVEPLGEPTGVGGGRRVIAAKLPLDETFTAWDEGEHFAFAVVASKIPVLDSLAESVRLEPLDGGGTRVVYRQGLAGRRGMGWAMALLWKRPERQLGDALPALKARVESTG